MQTRLQTALVAAISCFGLLIWSVPAAQGSSLGLAFPSGGGGKASPQLNGDQARNDFRVAIEGGGSEVVFRDRNGSPISLHASADRYCSGDGTATVTCPRRILLRPIPIRVTLGAGDKFDTGARGCGGGEGFESYFGYLAAAEFWGTAGGDQLYAKRGSVVHGCAGSDDVELVKSRFIGGDGADFVDAKGGTVRGGDGGDQVETRGGGSAYGDAGNDSITDGSGRSKLVGGAGRDFLGSGSGRDRLIGGSGKDELRAGSKTKITDYAPLTYKETPTEPDLLICGGGRDRAVAGKRSRLRSCEKVTRLPRVIPGA